MNQNQFNKTIPIQLIKGKDKKGNTIMKMRGIASTSSKDDDDETLDPSGFDVNYFLKYGFMNWNHQTSKDPTAIIGKPQTAYLNKSNQLIIDFNLFSDSEKAKQVFALQKTLEKEGLALGLSIEGDVIERGSTDKNHPDFKKVKKARITGCAVCPNPKNAETVAEIIKGNNFNSLSAYDDESEDTRQKAMSVESDSGQALAKESLNSSIKKIKFGKTFKKSMALKKIFLDLPTISPAMGEQIYNLVETIQKGIMTNNENNVVEVTEEAISKAYETLGIQKANEAAPVKETVETPAPVIEEQIAEVVATAVIEEPTEAELLERKENLQKSIEDIDLLLKPKVASATEVIEKSLQPLVLQEGSDLIKGLTNLMKGHMDSIQNSMDEKFKAVGQISKSLSDQVLEMSGKLEDIEKDLSVPQRKSILTKSIVDKKFAGQDELSKSIESGDIKTVSASVHKREICDMLTKSITATGEVSDKQLANDIMLFESAGNVTPYLVQKVRENHKIALIP